jgi:hypothetical protein
MAKQQDSTLRFAICIHSDDADLLTPRMIYQVLPDESAASSNYIRVIDNEGEDYLYPANYFIPFDFPPAIEHALLQASPYRGVLKTNGPAPTDEELANAHAEYLLEKYK